MTSVGAIYKLEAISDNPKYEGFGIGEQPSLIGKGNRYEDLDWDFNRQVGEWIPPHLSNVWQPLRVVGRVRPFNDFPCVMIYPAFSQRAIDVLGSILPSNGELLPLVTSVGSYCLFNCTSVADIIDFDQSIVCYLNSNTICEIDYLCVHQDRLVDLSIFTMRKWPGCCFVTDAVARRIREARLEGFEFRKIWPLPAHVPYWLHRRHVECHDELTAQPAFEGRPIRGNTVVLRLALQEEKPTLEECAQVEEIAKQVDAMLISPSSSANYLGNLEVTECAPGEVRVFFSCPDADELAKELRHWVIALDWPGRKMLLRRYGEFRDRDATEESVVL
jgi:hypothetical protein